MWRLGWQVGTEEGRQSQRELRFHARGEDPDQFAGWFGQNKALRATLRFFKGRSVVRFTWKPSRGTILFFSVSSTLWKMA